ncbi:hypothetical protein HYPSUDRAFT_36165 [Hypholoma sublateritium FD-334 SS-4]|uniref:Uncharacterized protein n=1 Tax=Hypholoma sublateritium (strain FD-334 SS-4) TaxID=945553 RepID=A0A0D2PCZ3_HYPSF|nr:hypothetical protein HYPSUDRAFT_36165 [Hypholoma sublateritium FD-334 SS-4]
MMPDFASFFYPTHIVSRIPLARAASYLVQCLHRLYRAAASSTRLGGNLPISAHHHLLPRLRVNISGPYPKSLRAGGASPPKYTAAAARARVPRVCAVWPL